MFGTPKVQKLSISSSFVLTWLPPFYFIFIEVNFARNKKKGLENMNKGFYFLNDLN
jgi:hypothetical protein